MHEYLIQFKNLYKLQQYFSSNCLSKNVPIPPTPKIPQRDENVLMLQRFLLLQGFLTYFV